VNLFLSKVNQFDISGKLILYLMQINLKS